jgi:hypothetical protein
MILLEAGSVNSLQYGECHADHGHLGKLLLEVTLLLRL